MSINQWLQSLNNPNILLTYFIGLPGLVFIIGLLHQRSHGERGTLRYLYSVLTYLSTIPGIFSVTLIGYTLFFSRSNLLDANVLIYFLPLISMIVTLMIIGQQAEFSKLPGFDKLSGLLIILTITFGTLLLIYKTRIFIGFFGSLEYLFGLGFIIFLLLKWALKKVFG